MANRTLAALLFLTTCDTTPQELYQDRSTIAIYVDATLSPVIEVEGLRAYENGGGIGEVRESFDFPAACEEAHAMLQRMCDAWPQPEDAK